MEKERGEESRGTKDVFNHGLVLNYLKEKELAFDVSKKRNKF